MVDSYRPVSVLPALSKVFEKVVLDQLYNYLTKNFFYTGVNMASEKDISLNWLVSKLLIMLFTSSTAVNYQYLFSFFTQFY